MYSVSPRFFFKAFSNRLYENYLCLCALLVTHHSICVGSEAYDFFEFSAVANE